MSLSTSSSLAVEARAIIKKFLSGEKSSEDTITQACFVTLTKKGELRGCIGYVTPVKGALTRAAHAACRDPRLPPVTLDELPFLDVEVSILNKPFALTKEEALSTFVAGTHGIIISKGHSSGLLLPQVFDTNTSAQVALMMTCQKAGLSSNAWKESKTHIEFFTVSISISQSDVDVS